MDVLDLPTLENLTAECHGDRELEYLTSRQIHELGVVLHDREHLGSAPLDYRHLHLGAGGANYASLLRVENAYRVDLRLRVLILLGYRGVEAPMILGCRGAKVFDAAGLAVDYYKASLLELAYLGRLPR